MNGTYSFSRGERSIEMGRPPLAESTRAGRLNLGSGHYGAPIGASLEGESSGGEERNRRQSHYRKGETTDDIGQPTICIFTHQVSVIGHDEDHGEQGGSDDAVDDRHEDQELDWIDG